MTELVKKARAKFRGQRGISEDRYVFYLDAGDNVDKISFSFKAYKNGLNDFLDRPHIKSINPEHFEIFVYTPANEVTKRECRNWPRPSRESWATCLPTSR